MNVLRVIYLVQGKPGPMDRWADRLIDRRASRAPGFIFCEILPQSKLHLLPTIFK